MSELGRKSREFFSIYRVARKPDDARVFRILNGETQLFMVLVERFQNAVSTHIKLLS